MQVELEAPNSLHEFVYNEIHERLVSDITTSLKSDRDGIYFNYPGPIADLLQLQTVTAAYIRLEYAIPRPKALMGHQNFQRLLHAIEGTRQIHPKTAFNTFSISAAGSGSSVMRRIKAEIEQETGLLAANSGDLLLRIKRVNNLWVVLVRLSPRPLATRSWRTCDMPGALNGPVAHIMTKLSEPASTDVVCNLMCGSGTMLIERMNCAPYKTLFGVDNSPETLQCARENLKSVANSSDVSLLCCDARQLPIEDRSVDVLLADLPFGSLVGSHGENVRSYPEILQEAARVSTKDARFVALTHEIRLMQACLMDSQEWVRVREIPISLRGLHPRVFVLKKRH